jgi:hypothetical protein
MIPGAKRPQEEGVRVPVVLFSGRFSPKEKQLLEFITDCVRTKQFVPHSRAVQDEFKLFAPAANYLIANLRKKLGVKETWRVAFFSQEGEGSVLMPHIFIPPIFTEKELKTAKYLRRKFAATHAIPTIEQMVEDGFAQTVEKAYQQLRKMREKAGFDDDFWFAFWKVRM